MKLTKFQYSVDEIKRKLSNYNNRKKNFHTIYEYPPVKCGKTYDGKKFYCLQFDEEFDKIQLYCDIDDSYKFTIDEAERLGYQYLK